MNGRLASAGAAFGLAAGTALVVLPSATLSVEGASTDVSVPVTVTLAGAGARSFDVGPVSAAASVPATGRLGPVTAAGTVDLAFAYPDDSMRGFGSGVQEFMCGLFAWGEQARQSCLPPTPPPPPPSTPRITVRAGIRVDACAWPPAGTDPYGCPDPVRLVTTAPATLILGQPATAVPVRALAAGPAGNVAGNATVWLVDPPASPVRNAAVSVAGVNVMGGYDPIGPAVAARDITRAAAAAPALRPQLVTELEQAALAGLAAGEQLVTPISVGTLETNSAAAVGSPADAVSVFAILRGRATAVSTSSLRAQATAALQRAAAATGRRLLAGSVRWSAPNLRQAGTVSFTAHGLVTGLDPADVRLAAALHSSAHIADVIHRSDPRATLRIRRGFGWSPAVVFLDRRAQVEVDGYPLN